MKNAWIWVAGVCSICSWTLAKREDSTALPLDESNTSFCWLKYSTYHDFSSINSHKMCSNVNGFHGAGKTHLKKNWNHLMLWQLLYGDICVISQKRLLRNALILSYLCNLGVSASHIFQCLSHTQSNCAGRATKQRAHPGVFTGRGNNHDKRNYFLLQQS